MFGYVKPVKAELLVREHEFYKATYCGICRAMKRHTGVLSNVTLSYDSVFLALVRMLYIEDDHFHARGRRCIAHPFTKRPMLDENPALEYTARAFAILTYYKLRDDLQDERALKKVAVSTLRPLLASANVRAALPALAEVIAGKLGAITALEESMCDSVDKPATLFGELLGEVFAYGLPESERTAPYYVGYHLGRFIYSADAAEDYERDRASGSYNPYVIAYGGAPMTDSNRQTVKCALLLECTKLEAAVNLLPFGTRSTIENIIRNTIYLGLADRIKFLDSKPTDTSEGEKN